MDEIPLLKRATLTEVLTIRVDRDIAESFRVLRAKHGLDGAELVRAFLRQELPRIKKKLENQAS